MQVPPHARTIAERVDQALEQAAETGREPATLVLGQEDYPVFQQWAREALGEPLRIP
jgi:hypothetical protein